MNKLKILLFVSCVAFAEGAKKPPVLSAEQRAQFWKKVSVAQADAVAANSAVAKSSTSTAAKTQYQNELEAFCGEFKLTLDTSGEIQCGPKVDKKD